MKKIILSVILCVLSFQAQANTLRDISYGPQKEQKIDVYLPSAPKAAPVIFMVHGGGWKNGDKEMSRVVENKAARWVGAGFIFISVNYPMLPDSSVSQQTDNIAKALAFSQQEAGKWGGDKNKFILMGHSAGGHLVSLLNANPDPVYKMGASEWLGTVSLDSAGMDIVKAMKMPHFKLYDEVFGSMNEEGWASLSPYHQLSNTTRPWLGVCSSTRKISCPQNEDYAAKAKSLGVRAQVLPIALKHGEINEQLGLENDYTKQVEEFMASLDPAVAALLSNSKATPASTSSPDKREGPLRRYLRERASHR
ncbi:MAG: esterase [Micavibrio aeruginosavorus]|uniref:Esterase n=1 Tax=Micavibrio aeruginosavorus TaxID=349221 RepID=A0A2W5FUP5_9BACT|nr:MAG: esterase [Micavibrio aeruginosavorus]